MQIERVVHRGLLRHVRARLQQLGARRRQDGAVLAEYAFILGLVVVVSLPFVSRIGVIVDVFYKLASQGFGK